jgi:hypothetical protein
MQKLFSKCRQKACQNPLSPKTEKLEKVQNDNMLKTSNLANRVGWMANSLKINHVYLSTLTQLLLLSLSSFYHHFLL